MAEVKKPAVAAKKPVAVKKEEVKAEAKAVETVKKAEVPAKKAVVKKEEPAKKAEAPAKKPAVKKAAVKSEEIKSTITLELSADRQYTNESLIKILKDVWKYDLKKKVSDIKTVEMYVKPYAGSVYYKVNGEVEGEFNI